MKRMLLISMLASTVALAGCAQMMQRLADFLQPGQNVQATAATNQAATLADADRDGVADNLDECAATPARTLVDALGCPVTLYVSLTVPVQGNSADVAAQAMDEVERIGRLLEENPAATALIEGHTDNRGAAASNQQLSELRAESVKAQIVARHQVAPERIVVVGYGDAKPLVSNATEAGRARNRRVEISVKGYYAEKVAYVALQEPTTLHFALGESTPGDSEARSLAQLAALLQQHPRAVVRIEGHTDNVGAAHRNLLLSRERAESVRRILVQQYAVPPKQVEAAGYGDTRPVADNATSKGRFLNRRVTITIEAPRPQARGATQPGTTMPPGV